MKKYFIVFTILFIILSTNILSINGEEDSDESKVYFLSVRKKLMKYLHLDNAWYLAPGTAILEFVIQADGSLEEAKILELEPPDNQLLKESVIASLNSAAPFEPFPESIGEEKLVFRQPIEIDRPAYYARNFDFFGFKVDKIDAADNFIIKNYYKNGEVEADTGKGVDKYVYAGAKYNPIFLTNNYSILFMVLNKTTIPIEITSDNDEFTFVANSGEIIDVQKQDKNEYNTVIKPKETKRFRLKSKKFKKEDIKIMVCELGNKKNSSIIVLKPLPKPVKRKNKNN